MISYEEYYPYGRSAYRAAASGVDLSLKRYRFTGKERDEETGLDYFGVRYYAPWLGRWTSSDPGGFVDGLNLYRYVRNNPVNGIDREGYSTEEVEKEKPKPPPAKSNEEQTVSSEHGFYYLENGQYLGYLGNPKNASENSPVFLVRNVVAKHFGIPEQRPEGFNFNKFIKDNDIDPGWFSFHSISLENGDGELMTHEQFKDRSIYHYGEGSSAMAGDWYAWSMENKATTKGSEDEIYRATTRKRMLKKDSEYTSMRTYFSNISQKGSENSTNEYTTVISKQLKAIAGITKDPTGNTYNWYGRWNSIKYAQEEQVAEKDNINILVKYKIEGDPVEALEKLDLDSEGAVANWSVNIFFDMGTDDEQTKNGSGITMYLYNISEELKEVIHIPKGKKFATWLKEYQSKPSNPKKNE